MAWFFKFSQTVAWWCHRVMHIPVWKAHSWTVCPRIMYHYLGMEFCCCAIRSCQVAHIILYPHHIPAMSPFIHILSNISPKGTPKEISMSRLTRTRPGCEHPLQVHPQISWPSCPRTKITATEALAVSVVKIGERRWGILFVRRL